MAVVRPHRAVSTLGVSTMAHFTPFVTERLPQPFRPAKRGRPVVVPSGIPGRHAELHDLIAEQPRGSVPCIDDDPQIRNLWTSEQRWQVDLAIGGCHICPARALCHEVGRRERGGTWGGQFRGRRDDPDIEPSTATKETAA